jgi:hypothetical protein
MAKSTGVPTTVAKTSTPLAGPGTYVASGTNVRLDGLTNEDWTYPTTTSSDKWIYTDDNTGRVTKRPLVPWGHKPAHQPEPTYPAYTPPPNVHAKIVEMLQAEMERARERIMEQAKSENLTPEQIGEAMHRAFLSGIQWAMDNLPEIAEKLGYKTVDPVQAVYAAMQMMPPVKPLTTLSWNTLVSTTQAAIKATS